jgi:outer membrane protein OmpA-like peptidoglycan-associated protein
VKERVSEAPPHARGAGSYRGAPVPRTREGRWLPWALAAGLGVLALAFLVNRPGDRDDVSSAPPAAESVAPTTSVYFDPGQSSLDADARRTLEEIADSARASGTSVELKGYTEQTADGQPDLTLAQDRADAVREALISEGVPDSKIVVKPPALASADDAGTAAESQRVEIRLSRSRQG